MLFHLKVRGSKTLTTITFSELVSDVTMLLKFTHQLFHVVSSNICGKAVISAATGSHNILKQSLLSVPKFIGILLEPNFSKGRNNHIFQERAH